MLKPVFKISEAFRSKSKEELKKNIQKKIDYYIQSRIKSEKKAD